MIGTVSISIFQFHIDLCITCNLPICLTSVSSSLYMRSKVHIRHQPHAPLLGVCMLIDRIWESAPGSAGNLSILCFTPNISCIHLCQEFHAFESEFKFELIIVDKTGNKYSTVVSHRSCLVRWLLQLLVLCLFLFRKKEGWWKDHVLNKRALFKEPQKPHQRLKLIFLARSSAKWLCLHSRRLRNVLAGSVAKQNWSSVEWRETGYWVGK